MPTERSGKAEFILERRDFLGILAPKELSFMTVLLI